LNEKVTEIKTSTQTALMTAHRLRSVTRVI